MKMTELPPLPTAGALEAMRKKARKQKIPKVVVGSHGCLPGVGEFRIVEDDSAACLEWQVVGGNPNKFAFDALSRDSKLAEQRLEVDWLIANAFMVDGRRIRDAIPGPNEAMRESAYFFNAEARWRHWAQVTPGHMIF
jgi:hypothetical protein